MFLRKKAPPSFRVPAAIMRINLLLSPICIIFALYSKELSRESPVREEGMTGFDSR